MQKLGKLSESSEEITWRTRTQITLHTIQDNYSVKSRIGIGVYMGAYEPDHVEKLLSFDQIFMYSSTDRKTLPILGSHMVSKLFNLSSHVIHKDTINE